LRRFEADGENIHRRADRDRRPGQDAQPERRLVPAAAPGLALAEHLTGHAAEHQLDQAAAPVTAHDKHLGANPTAGH
jgi:hypothetical protein